MQLKLESDSDYALVTYEICLNSSMTHIAGIQSKSVRIFWSGKILTLRKDLKTLHKFVLLTSYSSLIHSFKIVD